MPATAADSAELNPSLGLFDLAMEEDSTTVTASGQGPDGPEDVGTVIAGKYVLQAVLGEGGTGLVWRAEQREPVQRMVALKIIRPALAGEPVSQRFKRESQLLAYLEHPNIASVYDAGEMADGRTYLAMEMVMGLPITTWCRKYKVPLRQRLEVFLQACQGVQHAHQTGILHRDVKPSNVMVSTVTSPPLVKVIDFGIAKALSGDFSHGTDETLRGVVLGTPRYMSPEQAGLTGQDVDTRADVYALGVLLYELLTGSTPIEEALERDATLPDLLQQVCHTETELPSRRVTRTGARPTGPELSSNRLSRQLRGELDWIVLRALQKDRELRYPTVIALADDVLRFLKDEPVSAGPPGLAYQVKKWLHRHRAVISSATAVCVALAFGIATTQWALIGEEKQRQEAVKNKEAAQSEAELAGQVRGQLTELLGKARESALAGMNTQMLRQMADDLSNGMSRFAERPRIEAEMAGQLAKVYHVLEEPARQLPWLRRRWELLKQLDGAHAWSTLQALHELGCSAVGHEEVPQAVEILHEAATGLDELAKTDPRAKDFALNARKEMAVAMSRTGRHDEAARVFEEILGKTGVDKPARRAQWLRDYAITLNKCGRGDEAEKALREGLALVPPEDAALRSYLLHPLANLSGKDEDWAKALAASEKGLRYLEEKEGPEHPRFLTALINHAVFACRHEGCPGGEEAARRALEIAHRAGHESRLADAWSALAETLRVKRMFRESEQAVRAAILDVEKTSAERWRLMELHRRLGDLLTARGAFPEALNEYEIAFGEWFAQKAAERPPERERLIFVSIIAFLEKAEQAGSPLANPQKLAEWQTKLDQWTIAHPGWSDGRRPNRGGSEN